ncbi:AI-2E family transporter [Herbivorax sp. ANBcel31]|uniref:AI-2E family transporter n=1 Tax=Herbivorax sp. ANBcel31 TaxID=3069754 RepID=UPI0027AE8159|nr:AI-2E family transporter [Herbivorax sp. ANBcel31]MDQ2085674.1 AI-2E family transporter [Herbivorax sp. ANBcel31]
MTSKRKIFAYILFVVVFLLFAYLIYNYRVKILKLITPVIFAGIISYLIHPIVLWLEGKKIPRTWSILIIYFLISGILTVLIIFIVPHLINNTKELVNTLPDVAMEFRNNFNDIMKNIKMSKWPPDIKESIFKEINNSTHFIEKMVMDTLKKSLWGIAKTATVAFDLLVAMVIAYYLVKDAKSFRDGSLSLIPRKWRSGVVGCCREINTVLSNFIQGQVLTALIVGAMITTGFFIINLKYPLILGIIAGVLNIIPYFGPVIGSIPAVAVALIDSPLKALWTIITVVVIQQIDNAFISPKIIEGRLGLHPVTTILVVLIGGEFFGIVGMLLAVPVAAVLKVITKRLIEAIV